MPGRALAVGAEGVFAEDFGAAELLEVEDLSLGGLVLGRHARVADDGHDPLPLFTASAAVSPVRRYFQALRLLATARLQTSGKFMARLEAPSTRG